MSCAVPGCTLPGANDEHSLCYDHGTKKSLIVNGPKFSAPTPVSYGPCPACGFYVAYLDVATGLCRECWRHWRFSK